MNDYASSPAAVMLATHCVVCGRPLIDSISVEMGIGPECREGFNADLSPEDQKKANVLVHEASVAAQNGKVEKVLAIAKQIEEECHMGELAEKIRERFKVSHRDPDILIEKRGQVLMVVTPYRRGKAEDFKQAWRSIPGRRWDKLVNANMIPESQKSALWDLLKKFFPGKYGKGPQGWFRVPKSV